MRKEILFAAMSAFCSVARSHVPADTLSSVRLQEIDVVAMPKEVESTHRQPLASTQINGQQMQQHQVRNLKGVSAMAPSLFMPDYGSRLTSAIYIRGIGSRINNPAVGLYVDNVPYLDKSAFDFNLYDIERIEVLRGPQGTLYGRNTMGGLIRVHTRSPFDYQGTEVRVGHATGDHRRHASLTHYHRPSDRFAFSAGGYYEGASGFFRNDFTGEHVDHMQSGGGKWNGIWRPTNSWTVGLNVAYDYSTEGAYPYYYAGPSVPGGSVVGTDPYAPNLHRITANRDGLYRRHLGNASLTATHERDGLSFTSTTSAQLLRDRMLMDQDFMQADIYTLEQKQSLGTYTEELTLKSTRSDRWKWTTGLNLTGQTLRTQSPVTFYSEGVEMLQNNINRVMPTGLMMGAMPMKMAVALPAEQLVMDGDFKTPMLDAALFHQSTVYLSRHWAAIAGVRLDFEHNRLHYYSPATIDYHFSLTPMLPQGFDRTADIALRDKVSHNYFRALPKLALRYGIDHRNNLYASLSRGIRSGGYNVQMASDIMQIELQREMMAGIQEGTLEQVPDRVRPMVEGILNESMPKVETPNVDQTITYKPEESWNTEFGGHLQPATGLDLSFALYYINTRNQQIARFAPSGLGRMMVNAGKSRSLGGEFQASYHVDFSDASALSASLAYGYTNARFTDYNEGQHDYTDNWVPFAPQHTLNLDAAYSYRLRESWLKSITVGANTQGIGEIYWTEDNLAKQPFYALLNTHLTLDLGALSITAWGRNITATHYNSFYFVSASRTYEQHGRPAQFGVDLRIRF